jgi:hypothetical protein
MVDALTAAITVDISRSAGALSNSLLLPLLLLLLLLVQVREDHVGIGAKLSEYQGNVPGEAAATIQS